jgi:hypothetical protein
MMIRQIVCYINCPNAAAVPLQLLPGVLVALPAFIGELWQHKYFFPFYFKMVYSVGF